MRGIMALLDEPKAVGEIFNVGGDEEISINDLAARIRSMAGSTSELTHIPYENAYQEGFEDMERRVPDLQKIKRFIGYRNTQTLESMLAKVIEYERTRL
ncbi:MAG: hypothetical protein FJW35_15535 [Acidobacteria bacterium]|nr:hypothetical protein [Acidobacteriota bacterium]